MATPQLGQRIRQQRWGESVSNILHGSQSSPEQKSFIVSPDFPFLSEPQDSTMKSFVIFQGPQGDTLCKPLANTPFDDRDDRLTRVKEEVWCKWFSAWAAGCLLELCVGPGLWISCSCCNCPSNRVYSWDFSGSATDLLAVNSGHQAARSSTPLCCRMAAHRFL